MTSPFGEVLKPHFMHAPGVTYLNQGAFGSAPRVVIEARERLLRRQAQNPFDFIVRQGTPLLRAAAESAGTLIGANGADIAWVANATDGVNAVLRSFPFEEGDELLTVSHVYNAVENTMRFLAKRTGMRVVKVPIPFPPPSDDAFVSLVEASITPHTRFALFDHIPSKTAFVVPVARLVSLCRRRQIPVLIDGAHALGQLPLDLTNLNPDWYVANAHKWLYTPTGAAMLWTHPDRQLDTHPTTISHGYEQGYLSEFDYTGTRDITSAAVVPEAIRFLHRLGLKEASTYTRDLATYAADRCTNAWSVAAPVDPPRRYNLVTLPWPHPVEVSDHVARQLSNTLWERFRIVAPVFVFDDRLWIRLSVAIYNDREDVDRLVTAVTAMG